MAVVCNHAAGWGYTAMFWWADRYRLVAVPNFEQHGSPAYFALLVIKQLTIFSVPTFLFISGFFIAYANRGARPSFSWKVTEVRVINLLIPYLFWSLVIFLSDALLGVAFHPLEYLRRVIVGDATESYYYIPVIIQFYLLSPILIPKIRNKWKVLLLIAGLLQMGSVASNYQSIFAGTQPIPAWFCGSWAFFFALGLVSGFQLEKFKEWLCRIKPFLLISLPILAILSIAEPEILYRLTGKDWRGGVSTLSTTLFAVAMLLCFLAFDHLMVPHLKFFHFLSNRTLGIYLIHPIALKFTAKVLYHVAPWILGQQLLFLPLLTAAGIGIPLILMIQLTRTPARRFYSFIFG